MLFVLIIFIGVWTELSNSWAEIDALKETPWSAVVPRKVFNCNIFSFISY